MGELKVFVFSKKLDLREVRMDFCKCREMTWFLGKCWVENEDGDGGDDDDDDDEFIVFVDDAIAMQMHGLHGHQNLTSRWG